MYRMILCIVLFAFLANGCSDTANFDTCWKAKFQPLSANTEHHCGDETWAMENCAETCGYCGCGSDAGSFDECFERRRRPTQEMNCGSDGAKQNCGKTCGYNKCRRNLGGCSDQADYDTCWAAKFQPLSPNTEHHCGDETWAMENCKQTCGYCGCGRDAGSFDECFERRRRPTQEMNCGSAGAEENCGKTCGYNDCRRNLGGCSDQADYDTCWAAKFQPLSPNTEHHCGDETWAMENCKQTCGYCGCGRDAGSFDECFERRRRPTQELNCGSAGAEENCGKTCGYNDCRRNLNGCSDQASYDTCYEAKFKPFDAEHHCGSEAWAMENCEKTCGYCGCGSDAGTFDECFARRRFPTKKKNCGSDGAEENCGKTCGYNSC